MGWLTALAINGMVAYILISRAYQVADAGLIAPFEYVYIPIAALIGYLVWGEVPALKTYIGMALIISSGLFIGYRELISNRRRFEPPPTAETSFVPGSPPPQTQTVEEGTVASGETV
jgi:drug/metabolite transporter (DMT)-like permease